MVVVKQCVVLKTIMQSYISMLIFIAGISPITSIESENSPLNLINNKISKFTPKPKNDSYPPALFPGSVRETPVVKLDDFVTNDNQTTIIKVINKLKRGFVSVKEDGLPRATTVILNDNDTHHDTHNTSYINLNASAITDESTNSRDMASEIQVKSLKLDNNELSRRTTIIFLVSVALVSVFFYVFLVSLRKLLERKYGDRQLLVQNESRPEDI